MQSTFFNEIKIWAMYYNNHLKKKNIILLLRVKIVEHIGYKIIDFLS